MRTLLTAVVLGFIALLGRLDVGQKNRDLRACAETCDCETPGGTR